MSRLVLIGGHDPTGAAGVDVDRASAEAFGVTPVVLVTAFTDQDDDELRALGARDPALWLAELEKLADGPVAGVKFGLLPGAHAVTAATTALRRLRARHPALPAVVDPLLAASSGGIFLDDAGIEVLLGSLLPEGVVLTPNLPEAARLVARDADGLTEDAERLAAARELLERGASAVVIKGGHGAGERLRDLLLERGGEPTWFEHPRVAGRLRGTGCRYASALAACLALGVPLVEAARAAAAFVTDAIRRADSRPPA